MKLVIFESDWHDGDQPLIVNADQVAGLIPSPDDERKTALMMATDDRVIIDRPWAAVMERLVHGPFNQVPKEDK